MPRVARFRIAAIGELYRQLRFAPRETKTREMIAAEALIADIDPDLNYPQEFVIYRITGYRPEGGDEPLTLVGAALLGDLATFIQHLSDGLDLPWDFAGRTALTIDQVAERMRVSAKTIQRYRRRGLVCHYVLASDRVSRLVCFDDALRRFTERNGGRVGRATAFSRVGEATQRRVVEEARRLRTTDGLSLNETALRISRDVDRAHETIRSMLRRHDRTAAEPIFAEHGPLRPRDVRLIDRAWRWGVSDRVLARRFGKTPASIRRVRNRRRAERLRGLAIGWVDLPTFDLADAEAVILSAPALSQGLDALLPARDALALLEAAHDAPPLDAKTAPALLGGYNLLKRRAKRMIDDLPAWPGSTELERIEADLRWATALKRQLVSLALPAAIVRIEQNLHQPLVKQPADRIVFLLELAREVLTGVVESIDTSRDQQLARVAAYAMDRALAAPSASGRLGGDADQTGPQRAAARHEPGTIRLVSLFSGLTPWDEVVGLRPDLVARVDELDAPDAELVRAYYGLGPTPPRSATELARPREITPAAIARRLRSAVIELRRTRLQRAGSRPGAS